MATSTEKPKLKILCLHGYRQNGQAFREKTGSFRKALKKYAEFSFCDAPHRVGEEQGGGDDAESLGWWFSREDSYYKAVEYSGVDKGFNESVQKVLSVLKEEGPFDGVMAFSQGACFLALLSAMLQRQEVDADFKFVLLFAGFKSRCSPHDKYYDESVRIEIPALICYGDSDTVIPPDMGEELVKYFKNPVVVTHPGGHFVPNGTEQRQAYVQFLSNRLEEKQSNDCNRQ